MIPEMLHDSALYKCTTNIDTSASITHDASHLVVISFHEADGYLFSHTTLSPFHQFSVTVTDSDTGNICMASVSSLRLIRAEYFDSVGKSLNFSHKISRPGKLDRPGQVLDIQI